MKMLKRIKVINFDVAKEYSESFESFYNTIIADE